MWRSAIGLKNKNIFWHYFIAGIFFHCLILFIWDLIIKANYIQEDIPIELQFVKRHYTKFDPILKFRRREVEINDDDIIEKLKRKKRKKKIEKEKEPEIYLQFKKRYIDLVYEKVEENKFYPELEKQRGHQGEVNVKFIILKNGSVRDLQIVKKSSYRYLNESAIETVRSAVPFPDLPENLKKLTVIISIEYRLN